MAPAPLCNYPDSCGFFRFHRGRLEAGVRGPRVPYTSVGRHRVADVRMLETRGDPLQKRIVVGVLVALALVCIPVLVSLRPSTWSADTSNEGVFRYVLWILVLAALQLAALLASWGRPRLSLGLFAAMALLSAAAYFNFGHFHFPHFIHHHEMFHYQLGSKYFPEVGFDGLYIASIAAQQESHPGLRPPVRVRDLRSNNLVEPAALQAHREEVLARFTPQRWRGFVNDNDFFVRAIPPLHFNRIRRDHGYNPSPAWTFTARLLNGGELTARRLTLLATLDVVLLAITFAFVFRTYGARVGCLALVIFGIGWAGRFAFVGGAYLRADWLAATTIAVCMLKRGRPGTAGALLGYAAAVRLFPIAFLFGPALLAGKALLAGERPRWALRLFAGFGAALALAVAAGCLTGHGTRAWSDFASRMDLYRLSIARNAVGLESVVLYGPEVLARAVVDPGDEQGWNLEREDWVSRRLDRRVGLRLAQALLLGLLAAALWRSTPADAVILSMVALFALTHAANYYWTILLMVPLWRAGTGTAGVLLVSFAMYGIALVEANTIVRHGLFSWALLLLFLSWLVPRAIATLRRLPGEAGALES